MDRSQHYQWVELLDHHLGTAVCQTVHGSQHDTKAVEQRHTDTEFVVSREAHILTSEIAIVGNSVVCQHDTLGESRGTTGVLHVADIVAVHVFLHLVECLVLNILSQQQ